jgi:DNA-binding XRE family transcriptional regulator
MVNTVDFTKRLEKILAEYELSGAGFAQKIEVGRATISHILSGRNKPSLDFVLKVIAAFPEVDLYWLLLGKGNFPKSKTESAPTPLVQKTATTTPSLFSEKTVTNSLQKNTSARKAVKKIVIFYKDGTFENYEN